MQASLLTKGLKTPGFVWAPLCTVDTEPLTSLPIYFFTTSRGDIIVLTLCNGLTWLQQTNGLLGEQLNTVIVCKTGCTPFQDGSLMACGLNVFSWKTTLKLKTFIIFHETFLWLGFKVEQI